MKSQFLIVLVILLFAKCKKDPEYHPVGNEMVELLGFQTGSYWIMKDSSSGVLDSLVCTHESSIYHGDKSRYEHRSYRIYENPQSSQVYDAFWRIDMRAENARDFSELYFSKSTAIEGVRYSPFISVPSQATSVMGDTEVRVAVINGLSVNGRNFNNVYHVHYSNKNILNNQHFYINHEVGLIKIVQDNEQSKRTLLLERWSIIH